MQEYFILDERAAVVASTTCNAQRATRNLQPVTNRPAVSATANSNANKTTTAATATTTFDLNFKLNAF